MSRKETSQPYRMFEFATRASAPELTEATLDLRSIQRHWLAIGTIILISFVLAIVFITVRAPWYSASTRLMVDNRNPSLTTANTVFMTSDLSGRLVDSQVEILRSQKVMARALELLAPFSINDLLPKTKTMPIVLDALGIKKITPLTDEQKQNLALAQIMNLVSINRINETFTIEIIARSQGPELVVKLATAMADSFLEDQQKVNANAARGASPWLLERLKNSGTTARIIASATPPLAPDGPRGRYIIIAFIFAGMVLGVGAAFIYDILDTKIRTPEQASAVAQVECFGILPLIPKEPLSGDCKKSSAAKRWNLNYPIPENVHALNCCCAAATVERPNLRTIGVTSCMPGEGKSTIAVNLARAVAAGGLKVLLVDTATNNRDLSKQIAPNARNGLHGVLSGDKDISHSVVRDRETGVHFLPNVNKEEYCTALAMWGRQGPDFTRLFSKYDIVIFDLPAVTEDCAARVAAQSLDDMLLVIEYGKLPTDTALQILGQAGDARSKIFGVILNKVDEAKFETYASLRLKQYKSFAQKQPRPRNIMRLDLSGLASASKYFAKASQMFAKESWTMIRRAALYALTVSNYRRFIARLG